MRMALEALDAYSWEQVDAARTALKAALAEPVQEPVRCPLCNYQYGHQIGCENNPVDIALAAAQPRQQAEPVQYLVYWEYKHVDDGPETWRRVMPRTGQTLETALAEIQGYRRGLKRLYEVRALCVAAPPQRQAEPDTDCHAQGICQRTGYSIK